MIAHVVWLDDCRVYLSQYTFYLILGVIMLGIRNELLITHKMHLQGYKKVSKIDTSDTNRFNLL